MSRGRGEWRVRWDEVEGVVGVVGEVEMGGVWSGGSGVGVVSGGDGRFGVSSR